MWPWSWRCGNHSNWIIKIKLRKSKNKFCLPSIFIWILHFPYCKLGPEPQETLYNCPQLKCEGSVMNAHNVFSFTFCLHKAPRGRCREASPQQGAVEAMFVMLSVTWCLMAFLGWTPGSNAGVLFTSSNNLCCDISFISCLSRSQRALVAQSVDSNMIM